MDGVYLILIDFVGLLLLWTPENEMSFNMKSVVTYNLLNADTTHVQSIPASNLQQMNGIFKVLTVDLQRTPLVHHTEITESATRLIALILLHRNLLYLQTI